VFVEASKQGAHQAFSLFDDLLATTARLSASYNDEQLTLLLDLLDRFRADHRAHRHPQSTGNQPPANHPGRLTKPASS
jgi:hypothetical protein